MKKEKLPLLPPLLQQNFEKTAKSATASQPTDAQIVIVAENLQQPIQSATRRQNAPSDRKFSLTSSFTGHLNFLKINHEERLYYLKQGLLNTPWGVQ